MPVTLYKRQRQIVDFIAQYIQKYGYSPTLQEIATSLSVSSLATVHEHLQALIKKKILKKRAKPWSLLVNKEMVPQVMWP